MTKYDAGLDIKKNSMKPQKGHLPTLVSDDASMRTSVSFSGVIWNTIQRQMYRKGFNGNLSAYLADLARRDEERELEMDALRRVAASETQEEALAIGKVQESSNATARRIVRRVAKKAGKTPKP